MRRRIEPRLALAGLVASTGLWCACSPEGPSAVVPPPDDGGSTLPTDPQGLLDWIETRLARRLGDAQGQAVELTVSWGSSAEELRMVVDVADPTASAYCSSDWGSSSLDLVAVDRAAADGGLAGVWIQTRRLQLNDPLSDELPPPGPHGLITAIVVADDGRVALVDGDIDVSEADRSATFRGQDLRNPDEHVTGSFRCS